MMKQENAHVTWWETWKIWLGKSEC